MMPTMIACGTQGPFTAEQVRALDKDAKAPGEAVPADWFDRSVRPSRLRGMIVERGDGTHWMVSHPGFPLDCVWLRRIEVAHREVRRGILRRKAVEPFWRHTGESWAARDPAITEARDDRFKMDGFGGARWVDPAEPLADSLDAGRAVAD